MLVNLLDGSEASTEGLWGLGIVLVVAICVVSILIAVVSVVAFVLRIKIFFNYWVTNRQKTEGGYNGCTAATTLLQNLGYSDIQVKKAGFFRALFFSNHYNPNKKTVYLRASTYYGNHLTAVGLALQKVGLVIQDKRNSAAFKARWRLQKFAIFGPIVFIPIVLVGVIMDFVACSMSGTDFTGMYMLIMSVIGFVYFIASFILSFLVIKVEGKANQETLEIIKEYDFLTPYEQELVAKVFSTYRAAYICDFLVNILELIRFILKIMLNVVALMLKNNNGK